MQYKVIITGATGMVGKGVLLECLDSPDITGVLTISRSSVGISHPKLKEILLTDFMDIGTHKEQLKGYDACFFCMGISSVGMNEADYTRITFDIVRAFADTLYACNPDMVFSYVSGAGTDSTGSGKVMWARVKGKTENYILEKGFKDAYAFRPGAIIPERGIRSRTRLYQFFINLMRPFFPLLRRSKHVTTTTKIGLAMIAVLRNGAPVRYLENKDINRIAKSNG